MFIHFQVAFYPNGQIHSGMLAYLFKHMIEEAKTGRNITASVSIEIKRHINISLLRCTTNFCFPLTGKKKFCHLIPVCCCKCANIFQTFLFQIIRCFLQINSTATKILCQLHISRTITDYKAFRKIVFRIINILRQHSCTRFASRRIIFRKTTVDQNIIKGNAFSGQCFQHQVVSRPESFFRKRSCTQPVLIGNHHKFKIKLATDKAQITKDSRIKFQLFQ